LDSGTTERDGKCPDTSERQREANENQKFLSWAEVDDVNPAGRKSIMFRRPWTHKEILLVLARYPAEGPFHLAMQLGRSEDSVSSAARRFGLRTPRRPYRRRKMEQAVESKGKW
jgi:hypothetical protein